MSIIIRLQNLPWAANAMDIRQYFNGLAIPEGGVHIVGGELGDAFIAFSTDEDARQAFQRNNGKIKGIQIQLMLSSRTEMQRVIEQARNQSMSAFMLPSNAQINAPVTPAPVPAAVPAVPAAVPEIKKDDKDLDRKKDRRRTRSRSKSRDKRDRSRDRKDRRRDRDRTRSRSREKRDSRRRRDRSRSRNKSRDRESRRRDNRGKISPKREEREDNSLFSRDGRKQVPEVWANQPSVAQPTLNIIPPATAISDGLLGAYPLDLELTKRGLVENLNLQSQMGRPQGLNGFQGNNGSQFGLQSHTNQGGRLRDSWPPTREIAPNNFDMPANNFNGRGGSRDFNMEPHRRNFRNQYDESEPNNERPSRKGRFNNMDEGDSPVNACVSMEPFYGSYGDLRRFFQGLNINYKGIKIINDDFGNKTGICYVQFRDASIKSEALKMNGCLLNNMEVKIQHISDQVFDEGIDRFKPRIEDNFPARSRNIVKYFNSTEIKEFTCLKVEDLPSFVKEQDILHIFSQHPLISLHLNIKPKGGTVAYVKFSNKEVAKLALNEKSNHVVAGKTVTVKPCKEEEFENVCKEQTVPLETNQPANINTDCLKIENLPPKTSDRDISDFFSDIGVIPTKIHLMSNNLGFTGEAYCEFETLDEATKAVTKNKTALGQNTIKVTPIPRQEMNNVLNSTLPHPVISPGQPSVMPLAPIKPEESDGVLESQNKSSSKNTMNNPLLDLEEPVLHIEPPEHALLPPEISPPMRGFFPNNRGFGPRGGGRGGRFPPRGGGGPRFNAHVNEAPADDVPRGCTVFMDNVPYKAGTNEILDFFEGYNSTNNVSRRYNPNNTPSAEAKVTFYNPDDAFRAVRELNGKKIWGRSIYLTQS